MNEKLLARVLIALGLGILILFPACASAPSTPAPTPAHTNKPTGRTFQSLASAAESVYLNKCALCHGNNGQPVNKYTVLLWGPGSTLGNYHGIILFGDAQEMLNYMSKNMPLAAPGSLTGQQYIDLMAYILVQGEKVSPSTVFDQSKLSSIKIPYSNQPP